MAAQRFACGDCSFTSPRWFGRCPECGAWSSAAPATLAPDQPRAIVASLSATPDLPARLVTGIDDLDRVLGGGFVPGAGVLLAGEPGIGKSTLILQLLDGLVRSGRSVLVTSGEESLDQIGRRGRRLQVAGGELRAAAATSLPVVLGTARSEGPDVLVVDSIQTLDDPDTAGATGSVAQVRACAAALVGFAKDTGTVVVLVGHVTKDGGVAGPKTLEHLVDAVILLEGERSGSLRLLRTVKNRFGSCEETGVFAMTTRGLEPVEDPSAMLLADRRPGIAGSVVFPALEGTRPMLIEVQALVTEPASAQHPRRVALGVDARRLGLLLGVVGERADLRLATKDVFVASAGGFALREPAGDLAACLALHSAARHRVLDERLVAIGEVGLGGEIRRVPGCERRLSEAARLGFDLAVVPPGIGPTEGIACIAVDHVATAFGAAESVRSLSVNRRAG